jgi:hypothetical protein
VKINEYLESGVLEAYILGSASEEETKELLYLKARYPQVQDALLDLEIDMERIAQHMAIIPPTGSWLKIEDKINEMMMISPEADLLRIREYPGKRNSSAGSKKGRYLEVEAESSHMRIRKIWRWIFGAIFLLGKIFLAMAIFFYLESRQAKKQIEDLKTELKKRKTR